ncbi:MAG TPA: GAF domain-containing protein [Flavitalea sp.]|nr:GAF domain-containing protein [Flavitalea sp.]
MKKFFGKNIIPWNEALRLDALYYYDLLNDLPDRYFANLAHIIAITFNTPIALVTLVGKNSVLYKGNAGMEGTNEADRGISLCSLAILEAEPTVFEDALKEPCLLTNPLVAGSFGLRFYAGAPITTPAGYNIGTVCIVDKKPRLFSENESEILTRFAASAMYEIEMRKSIQPVSLP